jgi:hypothetical protein
MFVLVKYHIIIALFLCFVNINRLASLLNKAYACKENKNRFMPLTVVAPANKTSGK